MGERRKRVERNHDKVDGAHGVEIDRLVVVFDEEGVLGEVLAVADIVDRDLVALKFGRWEQGLLGRPVAEVRRGDNLFRGSAAREDHNCNDDPRRSAGASVRKSITIRASAWHDVAQEARVAEERRPMSR